MYTVLGFRAHDSCDGVLDSEPCAAKQKREAKNAIDLDVLDNENNQPKPPSNIPSVESQFARPQQQEQTYIRLIRTPRRNKSAPTCTPVPRSNQS